MEREGGSQPHSRLPGEPKESQWKPVRSKARSARRQRPATLVHCRFMCKWQKTAKGKIPLARTTKTSRGGGGGPSKGRAPGALQRPPSPARTPVLEAAGETAGETPITPPKQTPSAQCQYKCRRVFRPSPKSPKSSWKNDRTLQLGTRLPDAKAYYEVERSKVWP